MATKSLGTTFSLNGTLIGVLSSISEISCDSDMIDVTTLQSPDGCRQFMQGAKDAGEIRLTGCGQKIRAGRTIARAPLHPNGIRAARLQADGGVLFADTDGSTQSARCNRNQGLSRAPGPFRRRKGRGIRSIFCFLGQCLQANLHRPGILHRGHRRKSACTWPGRLRTYRQT